MEHFVHKEVHCWEKVIAISQQWIVNLVIVVHVYKLKNDYVEMMVQVYQLRIAISQHWIVDLEIIVQVYQLRNDCLEMVVHVNQLRISFLEIMAFIDQKVTTFLEIGIYVY